MTGKKEELTALESINSIHIVDARDVVLMTDSVLGVKKKKESSMVKALMMAARMKWCIMRFYRCFILLQCCL